MLDSLLVVLGVSERKRRFRNLFRTLVVFFNITAVGDALIFQVRERNEKWADQVISSMYMVVVTHNFVLYIWRLGVSAPSINRVHRFRGRHAWILTSVLVFTIGNIIPSMDIWRVMHDGNRLDIVSAALTDFSFMFVQAQAVVMYVELAAILNETACEIQDIVDHTSPACVNESCTRVESKCARLSHKLSLPLIVMHLVYFIRLVSEIPLYVAMGKCHRALRQAVVCNCKYLLLFLLVVDAGDSIVKKSRGLLTIIRKQDKLFQNSVHSVQVFIKRDHGIRFGFASCLTWKSCCFFLGITYSFTLMVYQSCLSDYKENSCLENLY